MREWGSLVPDSVLTTRMRCIVIFNEYPHREMKVYIPVLWV